MRYISKKINLSKTFFIFLSFLFVPILGYAKQQPNYSVIIFDCDGVLVDTEHLKFLAWKEALARHKVVLDVKEFMPLIGYNSVYTLQNINAIKKVNLSKDIIPEQKKLYKALQEKGIPPISAAVLLAKRLAKDKNNLGIKLALASSAPKAEIMRNLKAVGLEQAFDVIISGHDDLQDVVDPEGTNKPKPYIYQKVARWLNVAPTDCLVFEDTAAGVAAAAGAGMTVFAVPNQLTAKQDFGKAARVLGSLSELKIKEILYSK